MWSFFFTLNKRTFNEFLLDSTVAEDYEQPELGKKHLFSWKETIFQQSLKFNTVWS